MDDYIDFEKKFQKLIGDHKDNPEYKLIEDYPKIFSIVLKIAFDRNSNGYIKMIMNSAISYFITPMDVFPEKNLGVNGYLDDFFICIYALRQLLDYDNEFGEYLIKKYWTIEEDYRTYLTEKYYALSKKIEDKIISEILSSSGMDFVTQIISLKNNPRKYLELKNRDLQRRIQYLIFLFLNNRTAIGKEERKKFEDQVFGTEEFIEFTKKLEFLSKDDKKFEEAKSQSEDLLNIDERLKRIKARRLLK
jgi:uncharacterized membrane protein YkvA (DUF1232 family)